MVFCSVGVDVLDMEGTLSFLEYFTVFLLYAIVYGIIVGLFWLLFYFCTMVAIIVGLLVEYTIVSLFCLI